MITLAQRSTRPSTDQLNKKFLSMLPHIERQARLAFRRVRSDTREDLIEEVIANSFCAFVRLAELGKIDIAYPTPLAMYAIRQVRSGRRVGTKQNVRDISSRMCQKTNSLKVERLDRFEKQEDEWLEVLVEDRRATPADLAASRIDMADWLASLNPRRRKLATLLATGETTKEAAKRFGISAGRISQLRREFERMWNEFVAK